MDNVLGRKNFSIMRKATNIICCSEFYSLDEMKEIYSLVNQDDRLSMKTKVELLKGIKRVYNERLERLSNI